MGKSRRGIPKHDGSAEPAGSGITPEAERAEIEGREERLQASREERERRHGHPVSPAFEVLAREGQSAIIARESLRTDNGMENDANKVRTEWAGSIQPARIP